MKYHICSMSLFRNDTKFGICRIKRLNINCSNATSNNIFYKKYRRASLDEVSPAKRRFLSDSRLYPNTTTKVI